MSHRITAPFRNSTIETKLLQGEILRITWFGGEEIKLAISKKLITIDKENLNVEVKDCAY